MCDRVDSVTTLLLLIKSASVELTRDLSGEASEDMQSIVLKAGMHSLESLGVTRDEITEGTHKLIFESPLVSDVNHNPPVSAWD